MIVRNLVWQYHNQSLIFAVDEVLQVVIEHDSGEPSMDLAWQYHNQTLIFVVDEVLQDVIEHDSGESTVVKYGRVAWQYSNLIVIFAVDEVLQDVKEHDSGKPSMTVPSPDSYLCSGWGTAGWAW